MTTNGKAKQHHVEVVERSLSEFAATVGTRELAEIDKPDNPAPPSTALSKERTLQIVRSVTATALDELRQLRDATDGLMRAVTTREEQLAKAITEHADFAEDTVKAKHIIAETIIALRTQFENGLPPAPPTVSLPTQTSG